VTVIRFLARLPAEIVFCATILLVAKGWGITRDVLSFKEFAFSMVYSILFIAFKALQDCFPDGAAGIVILLLTAVTTLLFMRELVRSTNDASLHIIAHLLAISHERINPLTTPIYQKHKLYRRFQLILLVGATELLFYLAAKIFLEIAFLTDEVVADVLIASVIIMLCIVFRLKGRQNESYLRILGEEDGRVPVGLPLADIEGVDIAGGRGWTEGMALPRQSEIVRDTRRNVNNRDQR
jgi:hypothetical protein